MPLPVPVAPAVIVTQVAPELAVHPHPAAVVTVIEPVVPVSGADKLVGEIEKVHGAACVIEKVWPATVSVVLRLAVPVFGATE